MDSGVESGTDFINNLKKSESTMMDKETTQEIFERVTGKKNLLDWIYSLNITPSDPRFFRMLFF
jgi:hypothetical protein